MPIKSNFGRGEVCEGCQFRKAHRLPFNKSSSWCKAPLDLIHIDLMGSTRTPSFSEYSYMLICIDNYSKYTWLYFVKQKSDVFSRFVEFKEMVKGELGSRIKRLQTDNGGEFTSL